MKAGATGVLWTLLPHTTGRLPRVLVSPGSLRLKLRNNGRELGEASPSQTGSRESLSPQTREQLNREANARQSGEQRASQQRQYERSGGWSGSSSRGGGGWSRGGGGRRRRAPKVKSGSGYLTNRLSNSTNLQGGIV